ncbi:lysoplasmalogenase [Natronoglycomyces albus]|uniref:Lysoplasmalogenase n=1 Tax=Natronoglycomyces albus TaxID=2811108 RepID=A0A895XQC7_9ACTN|nr:lysoplasmalogenase [Natronoglycomyces albus]QSB05345.1 lysoplasmalogenase [Natronoglycomyces albus]
MNPRWILSLFGLFTAANLLAVAFGSTAGVWATKPVLMPILAAYLITVAWRDDLANLGRTTGRSLVPANPIVTWLFIGLACAWVADIALILDSEAAFLTGVAVFGLMQLCYLYVFARLGAWARLRGRRLIVPGVLVVFWATFNILLWDSFDSLAAPIAAYSFLLVSMAALAVGLSYRVATGAILFVVSDLMIGIRLTDVTLPGIGVAIMATYAAAQLLIITGILRARLSYERGKHPHAKTPDPRYL